MTGSVFSEAERRRLVAEAAGLRDRLDRPAPDAVTASSDAVTEFDEWYEEVATDGGGFLRRLELTGLTTDACLRRLSADSPDVEPSPDWVRFAADLVRHLVQSETDGLPEDESDRPFASVLVPLAEYAAGQVPWDDYPLVSDAAAADAERMLRDRLEEVLANPLYARFEAFRAANSSAESRTGPTAADELADEAASSREDGPGTDLYEQYVSHLRSGGFKQFLLKYPVTARLTITVLENWVLAIGEFLERLDADERAVSGIVTGLTENGVTSIESVGDRHAGGRATLKVETDAGGTVMYKPRSVGPAAAFNGFLEWMNDESSLPAFETPACLVREDYGWMEWVERAPCSSSGEVAAYYEQAGALLAVLYALRFSDGHIENLVAHGTSPVVVDLETVADPGGDVRPVDDGPASFHDESVLQTGFLPVEYGDGMSELAGLSLETATREDENAPQFEDVNTDDMELSLGATVQIDGKTLPRLDGEAVRPSEHADALREGFRRGYRFLLRNRSGLLAGDGPLEPFEGLECRFIFRATQTYATVRRRLRRPERLRDGVAFELGMEPLTTPFADGSLPEELWPIYGAERRALDRFDVPRLTIDTTDTTVFHRGEPVVEDALSESPMERVRDRIRSLDSEDLAEQLDYLRLAYDPHSFLPSEREDRGSADRGESERPSQVTDDQLRGTACEAIGRVFDDRTDGSEPPSWTLWRQYTGHGLRVVETEPGLYEGRLGIALAIAGVGNVLGSGTYADLATDVALDAVETRPTDPDDYAELGGGSGLGGDLYALTRIGTLAESDECIDAARSLVAELSTERIAEDATRDVLRGAAGLILGAATVYDRTGADAALERAVAAGEHLLDDVVSTERGPRWRTMRTDRVVDGFAHGTTGIAYALCRLSEISGDPRFRAVALDAVETVPVTPSELEAADFGPRAGPAGHRVEGWGNGVTGIGLGLTGIYRTTGDDGVRDRVEDALAAVEPGRRLAGDHLYRGNAGRIEWFSTAGATLGDEELERRADEQAGLVVERASESEGRQFELPWQTSRWSNPTFFNGTSGVAYTLVRLTNTELPNVLLWE